MSQTLQHQVKPSTDVSPPVQSESQLQRRAFPHEVESQADKAIAPPAPISADWQSQQEKMARARFNPGMISLYPVNPSKDEKEKPLQKKTESSKKDEEEKPLQKKIESPEKDEQEKPIQKQVESGFDRDEEHSKSVQRKVEMTSEENKSKVVQSSDIVSESNKEKKDTLQRKTETTTELDDNEEHSIQRKTESTERDDDEKHSVQRKTESTATNELEEDKTPTKKLVQTKLKVGQVGDRYEQEADQVAAKVMTMPDPGQNRMQRQVEESDTTVQPKALAKSVTPLVQRQPDSDHEDVQTKTEQQPAANKAQKLDRLEDRLANRGGGSMLPPDIRSFMESRFGADLSHVRVHTDFDAAEMNRELRAQAFTYRNHIFYAAGKAPARDELTAHELTHVIQQTGAKSLERAVTGGPPRNTLQAKISRVSGGEGIQPKRAPTSAKSDPAFQSVVTNTKAIAVEKKQHPPTRSKVTEVHAAAKPPSNEVESKAQDKQVQVMNQQQPGEFNAAAFQAALKQKIAEVAPSTMEETENFKNENKVDAVKQDIASQVGNEKQQASGPIEQKTKEAPDPKGITPKPVTPLPLKKGSKAAKVAAKGAAPKRKDESEISLQAGSQQLDQQMSSAKVTEEQLKKSNEPKFQDAANAKKTAQTDAAKAPGQYRQQEQGVVAHAETQAQMTASKDVDTMHMTQDRNATQVLGKQGESKGKDEQKRSRVADHIQGIYNRTKQNVETILNQLDQEANQTFDQGATTAQNEFNNYVDQKMRDYKHRRYSGLDGPILWAHDKFMGLPDEVNVFYQQGRDRYIASMDRTIAQVSNLVANRLNAAKAAIANGKKEIQTYVASLEPSLRQVGQEAAENIQSQFDELEQTINDKQNQLIESLAQKYNDNLKALDDRIQQMKDANKGLVQKAMDKVRDTINTIRDLKNMLMGILRKAAGVIELIIKDPIQFLKNLIGGLKQGFLNFKANIGKHLQQGLMNFLTGAVGNTGITMPPNLDLKGIFSLVTQVLGVTYTAIRSKATGKWGEKKVGHLETSFDAFKTMKQEGVGGLWNQIKGDMGNLKSLVIDSIRNFLIEKVVIAGVMWIISLFNPAAAFIRACKAIVDIIRFFIERGSQVMALVNAVLDAVVAIAQGALGAAANLVESAMVKALPVVLGFIASLLGLGGLTKKIQEIIQKVRKPIDKGIDKVFDKADKFIKKLDGKAKDSKLGQKAGSARDAAKRKKEAAQKWAEEEKEAGRRRIEQQKDKLKQKIVAGKNKFANSKLGQRLTAVDQWAKHKIDQVKNKWDLVKKLPGRILAGFKSQGKKLWDNSTNKFDQSTRFNGNKERNAKGNNLTHDERPYENKRGNLELAKAELEEIISQSKTTEGVEKYFPEIKQRYGLKQLEWDKLGTSSASIVMKINPDAKINLSGSHLVLNKGNVNHALMHTQDVTFKTDYIINPWGPWFLVGREMIANKLGPNHPRGSENIRNNLTGLMSLLTTQNRVPKKETIESPMMDLMGSERKYIKGHLLNATLGGPADDRNLYPITSAANGLHEDLVESKVKNWVNTEHYWVYYKVHIRQKVADLDWGLVNADLHCEASKIDASGNRVFDGAIDVTIPSELHAKPKPIINPINRSLYRGKDQKDFTTDPDKVQKDPITSKRRRRRRR
jgi:hypothetical protein